MNYARKRDHDYCRGYYLVTMVSSPRRSLFSRIERGEVKLLPVGDMVAKAIRMMEADSPEVGVRAFAIMPDHIHLVVTFRAVSAHPLGWHIRRLKARVTKWVRDWSGNGAFGVFEEDYHDLISFDGGELDKYVRYVKENPLRWQWKVDHPDFFSKHYAAEHPRLPKGVSWTAIGDLSVLDAPRMVAVIVHRRITEDERRAEAERYLGLAREGSVLIGGFISPGEREVARGLGAIEGAKVICLVPYGLGGYKPRGAAVRRLAEGKTLVLSGFSEDVPSTPICYDNCHHNNDWARAIAMDVGDESPTSLLPPTSLRPPNSLPPLNSQVGGIGGKKQP